MRAQVSATSEEHFREDNVCARNETELPKRDFLARSFDVFSRPPELNSSWIQTKMRCKLVCVVVFQFLCIRCLSSVINSFYWERFF